MNNIDLMNDLIAVFFYSGMGIVIFIATFFIMVKLTPFSVVKEIEEDQNISLAILFGSVFIALSIVIHAAIS